MEAIHSFSLHNKRMRNFVGVGFDKEPIYNIDCNGMLLKRDELLLMDRINYTDKAKKHICHNN